MKCKNTRFGGKNTRSGTTVDNGLMVAMLFSNLIMLNLSKM